MEYSLMEMFVDPSMIDQLTMGEKLIGSLVTMCMGMGVTFAILFMLWGIFALMAKINVSIENKEKATEAVEHVTPAPAASVAVEDDSQLVAVISAAIAAMEETSVNNLIVRRITRVSGQATPWDDAGRADGMALRKL